MNKDTRGIITAVASGDYDYVLHGCNCFNRLGPVVAKLLADEYPEVKRADQATVYGDRNKLGTVSWAKVDNGTVIVNVYLQYRYGPARQHHLDYVALRRALLYLTMVYPDVLSSKVAFPRIGTGNAGGRWGKVRNILTELLPTSELTLITT